MTLRIVLADDHALVRAGVATLLASWPDVEVVGQASDGASALVLVAELRPDLLLVDWQMPRMTGLEVLRQLQAEGCATRVLVLSMYAEPAYAAEARCAGAIGYLSKDAAIDELRGALDSITDGVFYLSPTIPGDMVEWMVTERRQVDPLAGLTARQVEVLRLIAKGCTSREVGELLGIGVKTVETYRAQLCQRLGIQNLAGLVRFAVRTGLVSPNE